MLENNPNIKASPEDVRKRLVSIYKADKYTYRSLADALNENNLGYNYNKSAVFKILTGEQAPPFAFITLMAYILGYSPTWIHLGIGEKKLTKEASKLITDIQVYRVELANVQAQLQGMQSIFEARITQQDREIADLRRQLKEQAI